MPRASRPTRSSSSKPPALGISGLNGSTIQVAAMKPIEKDNMPLFGAEATTKGAWFR